MLYKPTPVHVCIGSTPVQVYINRHLFMSVHDQHLYMLHEPTPVHICIESTPVHVYVHKPIPPVRTTITKPAAPKILHVGALKSRYKHAVINIEF
jgi:hypothetical protein